MAVDKKKVLIIENQHMQFQQLQTVLSSDTLDPSIEVLPKEEDFVKLISAVKVFLCENYPSKYRNKCLDYLLGEIKGKKGTRPVDLIILDYKLSGSIEGRDGIYLANKIWEAYYNTPILFLSRVDYARRDRYSYEKSIDPDYRHSWLMKGFLGEDTLGEEYIRYSVYNEIIKLTGGSEEDLARINEPMIKKVAAILEDPSCEGMDRTRWNEFLIFLKRYPRTIPDSLAQKVSDHFSRRDSSIDEQFNKEMETLMANEPIDNELINPDE